MSNTKEIRTKIKSIESTKKITKAMQMVAASKMRKAQDKMFSSTPSDEEENPSQKKSNYLICIPCEFREDFNEKLKISTHVCKKKDDEEDEGETEEEAILISDFDKCTFEEIDLLKTYRKEFFEKACSTDDNKKLLTKGINQDLRLLLLAYETNNLEKLAVLLDINYNIIFVLFSKLREGKLSEAIYHYIDSLNLSVFVKKTDTRNLQDQNKNLITLDFIAFKAHLIEFFANKFNSNLRLDNRATVYLVPSFSEKNIKQIILGNFQCVPEFISNFFASCNEILYLYFKDFNFHADYIKQLASFIKNFILIAKNYATPQKEHLLSAILSFTVCKNWFHDPTLALTMLNKNKLLNLAQFFAEQFLLNPFAEQNDISPTCEKLLTLSEHLHSELKKSFPTTIQEKKSSKKYFLDFSRKAINPLEELNNIKKDLSLCIESFDFNFLYIHKNLFCRLMQKLFVSLNYKLITLHLKDLSSWLAEKISCSDREQNEVLFFQDEYLSFFTTSLSSVTPFHHYHLLKLSLNKKRPALFMMLLFNNLFKFNYHQKVEINNISSIIQFLQKLYVEIDNSFENDKIARKPNVIFEEAKSILLSTKAEISIPEAKYNEMFLILCEISLSLQQAFLKKEYQIFANYINLLTDIMFLAYNENNSRFLLSAFKLNSAEDFASLFSHFSSNYREAFQQWFINFYLDPSKTIPIFCLSPISFSNTSFFFNIKYKIDYTDFTEKIFALLKIEPLDIITNLEKLAEKAFTKKSAEQILNSLRRIASKRQNLSKYSRSMIFMGKNPTFRELLQLDKFKPNSSDSEEYKIIYQLLNVIWTIHETQHLYGIPLDTIQIKLKINSNTYTFHLPLSGTYNDSLLKSSKNLHLETNSKLIEKLSTKINKLLSQFPKNLKFAKTDELLQTIIKNFKDNFMTNDTHSDPSEKEFVFIPVKFPGHVFEFSSWDDLVSSTNLGADSKFSGHEVLKIGKTSAKPQAILNLCRGRIPPQYFEKIKESLSLEKILSEAHLPQIMGICGYISAKSLTRTNYFFSILSMFKKYNHKRYKNNSNFRMSVTETALVCANSLIETFESHLQETNFEQLLSCHVNKNNSIQVLELDELFGHVYFLQTRKFKNPKILKHFLENKLIPYDNVIEKAYGAWIHQAYNALEQMLLALTHNKSFFNFSSDAFQNVNPTNINNPLFERLAKTFINLYLKKTTPHQINVFLKKLIPMLTFGEKTAKIEYDLKNIVIYGKENFLLKKIREENKGLIKKVIEKDEDTKEKKGKEIVLYSQNTVIQHCKQFSKEKKRKKGMKNDSF